MTSEGGLSAKEEICRCIIVIRQQQITWIFREQLTNVGAAAEFARKKRVCLLPS